MHCEELLVFAGFLLMVECHNYEALRVFTFNWIDDCCFQSTSGLTIIISISSPPTSIIVRTAKSIRQ